MNERIKQLAREAGLLAYNPDGPPTKLEKFAELIVRECISVVDNMADPEDSDRYFWAIQNVSQKIREHFYGVEE